MLAYPCVREIYQISVWDKSENTFIKYVRQGWLEAITLTDTKIEKDWKNNNESVRYLFHPVRHDIIRLPLNPIHAGVPVNPDPSQHMKLCPFPDDIQIRAVLLPHDDPMPCGLDDRTIRLNN